MYVMSYFVFMLSNEDCCLKTGGWQWECCMCMGVLYKCPGRARSWQLSGCSLAWAGRQLPWPQLLGRVSSTVVTGGWAEQRPSTLLSMVQLLHQHLQCDHLATSDQ